VKRLALALLLTACTKAQLVDLAMTGAKRPGPHEGMRVGDRLVLAGDLHTHVMPPDAPYHVSRELPETLDLARREGLDFVVLTPHVPRRFYADPGKREWVVRTQDELAARVKAEHPGAIVIRGMEYTDHEHGHVGLAFADLHQVLGDVAVDDPPESFFERWVAHGGVLTINHPVERPLPRSPFVQLRYDLSWRAFAGKPVPPEIAWVTSHAQTIETFNTSITHLRDQYLLDDEERTLREAAALVDRLAQATGHRVSPVGGSDSHGSWLRATTFVLAKERSASAIRDALLEGRTCVRDPAACTLEVDGRGVGEAITASGAVRARARGGDVAFVVDGAFTATAKDGELVTIPVGPRCTLVRAVVGLSWSAPVYVNCPWAQNVPPKDAMAGAPPEAAGDDSSRRPWNTIGTSVPTAAPTTAPESTSVSQ
jgi:hypothetical protein